MIFVISKLLFFVMQPFNWVVVLLLLGLFHRKNGRLKRRCFRSAVGLVVVLTNPLLLNIVIQRWEGSAVEIAQLNAPYDVGIVLGGYIHTISAAPSQPVFNPHGNRLFQAIKLYKLGKIRKILLTGGSGSLLSSEEPEANIAKRFLLDVGVPEQDILTENQSRNTHENASYTQKLLSKTQTRPRCLLLTSAFHMRRSSDTFRKAGIEHDVFPTDFLSIKWTATPNNTFMPDDTGFHKWQLLLKEWVGYLSYKLRGQI